MNRNDFSLTAVALVVCTLLLSACAPKQWRDPLQEKEENSMRTILMKEQALLSSCTCCIDSEITAVWNSQLYDGGITGYLQLFLPDSFKLVAINPLGQPLFAMSTDQKTFQTINAVKGVYKHGKLASFVERHSLPQGLLQGDWATWLSGRMIFTEDQLKELRQDVSGRGIWLLVEKEVKTSKRKEYILYDTTSRRILQRIPLTAAGDELATIIYNSWDSQSDCPVPTSLDIHGGSFGTDISIGLSEIRTDEQFDKESFHLKLPPGYLRQYYP